MRTNDPLDPSPKIVATAKRFRLAGESAAGPEVASGIVFNGEKFPVWPIKIGGSAGCRR